MAYGPTMRSQPSGLNKLCSLSEWNGRTRTCGSRTRTCKLVHKDPRGQGLSSRIITQVIDMRCNSEGINWFIVCGCRYTTKHLNDETTPKAIKNVLAWCRFSPSDLKYTISWYSFCAISHVYHTTCSVPRHDEDIWHWYVNSWNDIVSSDL